MNVSLNKRSLLWPVVLVAVAVGLLCVWWLRPPADREEGSSKAGDRAAGQANAGPTTTAKALADLEARADRLEALADEALLKAELEDLRAWLASLDPEVAAGVVERFLAGGRDLELPFAFTIGDGGALASPPSLRVALLDFIGALNPAAAAEISRQVLETPTTADEWAISLRNVGRLSRDADSLAFLRDKTEELIRHPEWQESPSVGYLNAFDALVHARAVESAPLLSSLVQRKDRPDLAHAGFLTIDRLTQREPVPMLGRLADDTKLHASRPEMVAQQMARADLRQPDQRDLLRRWLLDPERTAVELQSFAGVFPNANQMVSRNLLTGPDTAQGEDLRHHDLVALQIVEGWRADSSMDPVKSYLDTMHQRLQYFTGQDNPARSSDQ